MISDSNLHSLLERGEGRGERGERREEEKIEKEKAGDMVIK